MTSEDMRGRVRVELGDGWRYFVSPERAATPSAETTTDVMLGTITLGDTSVGALVYSRALHFFGVMNGNNASVLVDQLVRDAVAAAAARQGVEDPYLRIKAQHSREAKKPRKRKKLFGIC